MTARRLADFERRFPHIPWRDPVKLKAPGFEGWACRVCVGEHGLKAGGVANFPAAFESRVDCAEHLRVEHGVEVSGPHMLAPEDFPVTIEAVRASDGVVVWKAVIERPAGGELDALYVPPLAREHGPLLVRTTFATGVSTTHDPNA